VASWRALTAGLPARPASLNVKLRFVRMAPLLLPLAANDAKESVKGRDDELGIEPERYFGRKGRKEKCK